MTPRMSTDGRRSLRAGGPDALRRIVAVVLAGALLLPATASAQTNDKTPSITVQGQAEVHVQPDMATVSVGVSYVSTDADDAMAQVSTGLTAIIAAVRALGIQSSDIQTNGLSLQPIYRNRTQNDDTPPQITGYRATNNVSIVVRDITQASAVLDAAVNNGATNIGGVSFGLSDPETPRRQALAEATANAEAKAEAIAAAAGVTITGVLSISEDSTTSPTPRIQSFAAAAPAAAPAPPVETGEMTVRATVHVSYSI